MSNTVIQLEFLKVEEGKTVLLNVPEDCTAVDVADYIRQMLHMNKGMVLTDVYIDHVFKRDVAVSDDVEYDDPIEMVMNMTNPGLELTVEQAEELLSQAEANGWSIPVGFTAKDFLDIYYDLEPEEEDE